MRTRLSIKLVIVVLQSHKTCEFFPHNPGVFAHHGSSKNSWNITLNLPQSCQVFELYKREIFENECPIAKMKKKVKTKNKSTRAHKRTQKHMIILLSYERIETYI